MEDIVEYIKKCITPSGKLTLKDEFFFEFNKGALTKKYKSMWFKNIFVEKVLEWIWYDVPFMYSVRKFKYKKDLIDGVFVNKTGHVFYMTWSDQKVDITNDDIVSIQPPDMLALYLLMDKMDYIVDLTIKYIKYRWGL